ncbi:hypothetical protein C9374_004790 [Naegleria lovaniensis]|uniref:Uncharacterized protein n=1 Tax=Naegleria lovaniensis TaxID=51637 RepID=A0AA88GQT2_NAELO|nr:uncharacterized protein C9374_004790 [Naegleria lovaniensis]KAG2382823.1 hypothetical protein C9374_004790 [Naegleria lovaniensis]
MNQKHNPPPITLVCDDYSQEFLTQPNHSTEAWAEAEEETPTTIEHANDQTDASSSLIETPMGVASTSIGNLDDHVHIDESSHSSDDTLHHVHVPHVSDDQKETNVNLLRMNENPNSFNSKQQPQLQTPPAPPKQNESTSLPHDNHSLSPIRLVPIDRHVPANEHVDDDCCYNYGQVTISSQENDHFNHIKDEHENSFLNSNEEKFETFTEMNSEDDFGQIIDECISLTTTPQFVDHTCAFPANVNTMSMTLNSQNNVNTQNNSNLNSQLFLLISQFLQQIQTSHQQQPTMTSDISSRDHLKRKYISQEHVEISSSLEKSPQYKKSKKKKHSSLTIDNLNDLNSFPSQDEEPNVADSLMNENQSVLKPYNSHWNDGLLNFENSNQYQSSNNYTINYNSNNNNYNTGSDIINSTTNNYNMIRDLSEASMELQQDNEQAEPQREFEDSISLKNSKNNFHNGNDPDDHDTHPKLP